MIKRLFLRDKKKADKLTLSRALDLIKRPIVTEKLSKNFEQNYFYFQVDSSANKQDIAKACELIFGIKVKSVNTLIQKFGLSRFKTTQYKKSPLKKAYVKFVDKIDINTFVKGVS